MVAGPGGAGKGTVIRRLTEREPSLWLSRSWTTRARREGEAPDAYTFVSRDDFLTNAKNGGFLEWATVLDEYYGTPIPAPQDEQDVVLEIDVQGAEQILERCENVICVALLPPSRNEQEKRLRARGDSEDHVQNRLRLGDEEIDRLQAIADVTVINDEVDQAVDELQAIIKTARQTLES